MLLRAGGCVFGRFLLSFRLLAAALLEPGPWQPFACAAFNVCMAGLSQVITHSGWRTQLAGRAGISALTGQLP